MSFAGIPIRNEGQSVNVSWWNSLRAAGVLLEAAVAAHNNFTVANNQTNANVTSMTVDGIEYTSATVRIELKRSDDSPTSVMAVIILQLYYKGSTWKIVQQDHSEEDDCGVTFDIQTTGSVGQVRYTSTNFGGASYAGSMKWAFTDKFAV